MGEAFEGEDDFGAAGDDAGAGDVGKGEFAGAFVAGRLFAGVGGKDERESVAGTEASRVTQETWATPRSALGSSMRASL